MNHWTCEIPGCRGCGAGYPSDTAAARAKRRHDDAYRAYHSLLAAAARTGVEQ